MRIRNIHALAPVAIALLTATAFTPARPAPRRAAPPLVAADGITFTYRIQSSASARAQEKGGAPSPNMVGTVRMSGGNARMDFREGSMPMTQGGGYMLIRGAEQRLVMVNVKERQAMVISADGLGSGFGSLTNNALLKMTVRDPHFSYEELGAGERILGYSTRRVRVHSGSTMEMRVLGRTTRTTDSSVTEQWIASRPAGIDEQAMLAWSRAFGMGIQRTNPDMARLMTDYRRKYGDGLALRTIGMTTATDDKGKARTDTIRIDVTDLSRGALDPSLFEIPAGYQTVDMQQMATAADSARRANGDTGSLGDAMRDGAKQGAAEKAKNALGGLFGRRRP